VSSGEEENKSGGEVRRAEREMEEGQAPSVNKTKVPFLRNLLQKAMPHRVKHLWFTPMRELRAKRSM